MTTKNPDARPRITWLLAGASMGALGLAAVLWTTGHLTPAPMNGGSGASGPMRMEDTDAAPAMQMAPGVERAPGPDMAEGMAMGPSESVRITPDQIRRFGITFAMVEERDLEADVRSVGIVEVAETRLVEVTTKFPGYVEVLHADFTGKAVARGEPLVDVYAPDLVAAQEELLLARRFQAAVGTVGLPGTAEAVDLEVTARQRLNLWDIDDSQIEVLLAEGRPRKTLSLRAPVSGVVLEKSIVPGSAFRAGQTLFRIADLSELWIDVKIRESAASLVGEGASVDVRFTAYPGEIFTGSMNFLYPTVDERTRSVRARVVVPNGDGRLRPGMYATAHVRTPTRRALSVPIDAVVRTGERHLVFVEEASGLLRPTEVELGLSLGGYAVVLSGVTAGQRVVTSAQYLIDAEANIGAIMRSMMGMMGAGDMGGMDMESMDMPGPAASDDSFPADTTAGGR